MRTSQITAPKANVSLKIDIGIKSELQHIANNRDRSLHYIMIEALETYIVQKKLEEQSRQAFYDYGLQGLKHYDETGLHTTHEEVTAWVKSLSTNNPQQPPKCHK